MEGNIYICTYLQLIHVVVQQKLTQHCKAVILQLKKEKNMCKVHKVIPRHRSTCHLWSGKSGFMQEMIVR